MVECPHESPAYAEGGGHFVIRAADVAEGQLDLTGLDGGAGDSASHSSLSFTMHTYTSGVLAPPQLVGVPLAGARIKG
jgi:hypothetical protein